MMFDRIIEKQFSNRDTIVNKDFINSIYEKNKNDYSYKLFQILDNKLYVKSNIFPEYETRFETAKSGILGLLSKYKLPDMEFVYFDGDSLNTEDPILISTSTKKNNSAILVPDFVFQFWPETHLFDYSTDLFKILRSAENIGINMDGWRSKSDKIFYRGSLNNPYRERYSLNNSFMDTKSVVGFHAEPGNPNFNINENEGCRREDKAKNKFLLHLNGGLDNDYSSAFRFNLACCSLVFYATQAEQKEWWQDPEIFKENEHYIKVTNVEELKHVHDYFLKEEEEAFKIAKSGYDFVYKYLLPESVEIYYRDLLIRYSKILNYKIELAEGSIQIENYIKKPINYVEIYR